MYDTDMLDQEESWANASDTDRSKKIWPNLLTDVEHKEAEAQKAQRNLNPEPPKVAAQAEADGKLPEAPDVNELYGTKINYAVYAPYEGGRATTAYVPKDSNGFPHPKSGPTIATGVDLGSMNESDAIRIGITEDPEVYNAIEGLLGKKGAAAQAYLDEHKTSLKPEQAEWLDKKVAADIAGRLIAKYESAPANKDRVKFADLPEAAQTVIYSVAHQFGSNVPDIAPRFWNMVTSQDWNRAYGELNNFGGETAKRRQKEGEYLFENLLKGI